MIMATYFEVDKRNGGCGVVFEGKLYVWGGETTDKESLLDLIGEAGEGEEDEELAQTFETVVTLPRPDDENHPFDVFDFQTCHWSRQATSSEMVPSVGLGSSLVVHLPSRSFFLYGGWNDAKFDSEVYRVSADTWRWNIVEPSTDVKPSPRYLTGVLIHEDRLCMFGGVGPDIVGGQDPGARYVAYETNNIVLPFGWNNEYYEFEFKSSKPESHPILISFALLSQKPQWKH